MRVCVKENKDTGLCVGVLIKMCVLLGESFPCRPSGQT